MSISMSIAVAIVSLSLSLSLSMGLRRSDGDAVPYESMLRCTILCSALVCLSDRVAVTRYFNVGQL